MDIQQPFFPKTMKYWIECAFLDLEKPVGFLFKLTSNSIAMDTTFMTIDYGEDCILKNPSSNFYLPTVLKAGCIIQSDAILLVIGQLNSITSP